MSQSPFSDAGNPYQAPASATLPAGAMDGGTIGVSPRSIELLKATRPWVRFLSILGFLVAGLCTLGAAAVSVMGVAQGQFEMTGAGAVYLVAAMLYFIGALFLGRYASNITTLERLGTIQSLEDALAAQKSFWRYTGILVAVVMSLYVLVIAIAVVVGVSALAIG